MNYLINGPGRSDQPLGRKNKVEFLLPYFKIYKENFRMFLRNIKNLKKWKKIPHT